jgi:hypothetical protein
MEGEKRKKPDRLEDAEDDDEGKVAGDDGGKTVTLGISLPR